ncbi:MAG: cytochrome c [Thiobacillaceae bacterium]
MNSKMKIALFAAALAVAPAFADGNAEAGKAKSTTCAACHGPDGNSTSSMFPKLAGQHPDYLFQALKAYKTGTRKNAIMNGQAASLSEADMADLAEYCGSRKGLTTKY